MTHRGEPLAGDRANVIDLRYSKEWGAEVTADLNSRKAARQPYLCQVTEPGQIAVLARARKESHRQVLKDFLERETRGLSGFNGAMAFPGQNINPGHRAFRGQY
jgi:hypothetical protein